MKQVNAVSAQVAQILKPIRFHGDDVRERLVMAIHEPRAEALLAGLGMKLKRQPEWICEGVYRQLLRAGARMVVLEER